MTEPNASVTPTREPKSLFEWATGVATPSAVAQVNPVDRSRDPMQPPDMGGPARPDIVPTGSYDKFVSGEIESDTSAQAATYADALAQMAAIDRMAPMISGYGRGPGQDILYGEDFNPLGGAEGKKNFREAYDPSGTIAAVDAGQAAEEGRNKALGTHFQSEQSRQAAAMAAISAKRQEDQAEEQRRMAAMDQQVQTYTANLNNSNQYWTNPGNIISAIAFSLMPIAGGDPAAGARLISQAVDADFNRRKTAADMHLGELRSNLAGYRKIAGDRQAGDLLAESEARRIASMEVDRIATQFASPISKAKAEAAKSVLMNQAAQLRMQAYRMGAFVPAHAVSKPVGDVIRKGGGYTQFGQQQKPDGLGYAPKMQTPGAAGSGAVSTIGSGSSAVPTTANTSTSLPSSRLAALAAAGTDEIEKQFVAGSIKPADVESAIGMRNLQEAMALSRNMDPQAISAHMAAKRKAMTDGLALISKPMAEKSGDIQTIRLLRSDLQHVGNFYRNVLKKDPEEFMGSVTRDISPALNKELDELRQKYSNKEMTGTPAQKDWQNFQQASMRLQSLFAKARVKEIHDYAGSALSPSELANLNMIITNNPSFNSMAGWSNQRSTELQAFIDYTLNGAGPETRLAWMAANPGWRNLAMSHKGQAAIVRKEAK